MLTKEKIVHDQYRRADKEAFEKAKVMHLPRSRWSIVAKPQKSLYYFIWAILAQLTPLQAAERKARRESDALRARDHQRALEISITQKIQVRLHF